MERLPTEQAITAQTRAFKRLDRSHAIPAEDPPPQRPLSQRQGAE
jgi:hypothetical protein